MKRKTKADPAMKDLIKQMLRRMTLGILPPRFCKYTDREGIIEFGVICHVLKAVSERERAKVADCVRELFEESCFEYPKPWLTETSEEDGMEITYSYPPKLLVRTE
jgi:hypothetical protein